MLCICEIGSKADPAMRTPLVGSFWPAARLDALAIRLLALLVGASDALDAVAVGQIVVGGDVEVGQLDGDRAVEVAENSCESLR